MSSNPSKWPRKRSIDEIEDEFSRADDNETSRNEWKVKTLDEILAEREKRRKVEVDSLEVDEENSRQSFRSSGTSSPMLVIDSKGPSQNQTPTQEIIYQLSPDHSSPLSSSSETSKKKAILLQYKGRRKTDEEEGEILSDISDGEPGGSKRRSRASSRHVSTDIDMAEKATEPVESPAKEESEDEEESSEEESDTSSEEEANPAPNPTTIPEEEESSEEDDSSESSEESDDSSDEEDEEEKEAVEKSKIEAIETKNVDNNVVKMADETSEDESDSDEDDSDSDDSEESDSSEEEEEKPKKEKLTVNVETKTSKSSDNYLASKKSDTSTKRLDSLDGSKDSYHGTWDDSSKHRRMEHTREDKRKHSDHERSSMSREKRERKPTKEESDRQSKKEKSDTYHSDYKKSRDLKRTGKERDSSSKSRDRTERQDKTDIKRKDSKTSNSKEQLKSSDKERESKSSKTKTHEKVKEKTSNSKTKSKLLTEEERLQFSTEVVEADSDEHNSDISDHEDGDELDISESKEEEKEEDTKPKLPDYLPAIQGCRNVSEEFVWLNRIEEGTYGVVYRARDKRTNEIVALKRLKMEKEKEGFPITSLREINTLLKGQHPNIVTVREVVVGGNMDKIFIVMDYVEHDLKTLMEHMNSKFAIGEVKTLLVQLLRAVAHLHDNWILHRDLKTSNLLLSNKGILKVADFGLAREYGSPLKPYTPIVVTLWYRAPELLLGIKEYACPIDLWSVGCIFAELLTMKPLFPGKSEIDQINRIFKDLGTPSDKIWPGPPAYSELPHVKKMTFTEYPYNQLRNKFGTHLTDKGFDLLNKFLTYDPKRRITADKALEHEYFDESPYPVKPDMFPTWPAKSEMMKRPKKRDYEHSPKPPEGGEMFSKLVSNSFL